jgi:hypothetical protein
MWMSYKATIFSLFLLIYCAVLFDLTVQHYSQGSIRNSYKDAPGRLQQPAEHGKRMY